jgi:hypothetical protein
MLNINSSLYFVPLILGIIECIISIVFLKIDERTRFLIKHAEKAIIAIENKYYFRGDSDYSNAFKIFTNEVSISSEKNRGIFFLKRQISHRISYKILVFSFLVISIIGSIISVIFLII